MCRHYAIDHAIGAPTIVRGVVQMGTVGFNYLI
jgi:hypothetical protein